MTIRALSVIGFAAIAWLLAPAGARAQEKWPCEIGAPAPMLAEGTSRIAFEPDSSTTWQPIGGEVLFKLKGANIQTQDMKVYACFRWHGTNGKEYAWQHTITPRVTSSSPTELAMAVTVPQDLNGEWPSWISNLGKGQTAAYTGFGLVPLADMRITMSSESSTWKTYDLVHQVGVTHRWFALLPTLLVLGIAWAVFVSWGHARGIRGGLILRVVSSPSGVASLSQFQIMLWTFVIAASTIYIMALSGSLIDIPQTMLGLLGISGVATLGAKFSASSANAAPAPSPPGAVTALAASGPATDSSVTLTWTPCAGADASIAYTVQVREAGKLPWSTAAAAVAAPPFAVTGLSANTAFEFQVFAVNAAGSGPPTQPLPLATSNTGALPAGAPGATTNLLAIPGKQAAETAILTWRDPVPAPGNVVVQYRRAGSWIWATASGSAVAGHTVTGLDGGTDYEFQVFGVSAGIAGPAAPIATLRTGPRHPRWSDLVVTGGGSNEIDVTRLQMLLFTLIAAAFVAMKVFDNLLIPDIPSGMLTLMTLSNSVYLGAKFIPGPRA